MYNRNIVITLLRTHFLERKRNVRLFHTNEGDLVNERKKEKQSNGQTYGENSVKVGKGI